MATPHTPGTCQPWTVPQPNPSIPYTLLARHLGTRASKLLLFCANEKVEGKLSQITLGRGLLPAGQVERQGFLVSMISEHQKCLTYVAELTVQLDREHPCFVIRPSWCGNLLDNEAHAPGLTQYRGHTRFAQADIKFVAAAGVFFLSSRHPPHKLWPQSLLSELSLDVLLLCTGCKSIARCRRDAGRALASSYRRA